MSVAFLRVSVILLLPFDGRLHKCGYLVITKISDASDMCVPQVRSLQSGRVAFGIMEPAFIYFDSDLPVCFSERDAGECPAVDFLHGEEIGVKRAFENMFVYFDVAEHVVSHSDAVVHKLERGEENVLEQLIVTAVAMWHVAAQHGNFVLAGEDAVAFPAYNLPYVRILLVRHDARTGGQAVRKVYKAEILAHVHAAVRSKFVESQGYASYCRSHAPFRAPAAHLGCNAVVVGGVESEQSCRHLPVQGE